MFVLRVCCVQVTDPVNGLVKPRLNLKAAAALTPTVCTPTVSPRSVKAANTGGSLTLQVTPPSADCTWSLQAPSVSWLRFVGAASGTGPGTVTLQVDPVTTASRSTGVVVASPNGAATVLVSQAVATATVAAEDSRPPTMPARVQGSTSRGAITLTWAPARDSQSGVSSYQVVYNQGNKQPYPRCTTGTAVNQQPTTVGTNLQLTVAGLSAGAKYTFRVCAIDGAGNVALGGVWRGTAS